ncbi:sperm flagellar 1 [Angomonas deanei]|uniref:CH-like domain in sperm protein/CAMSAP CH domain containing protein, putative n=1 Tax=Angomonas deanei TaxID=59799 RepID=A0A7G2C9K4_9TRYP|nr:sperm flagellar 1 [Angomonas deanei]CAD2215731.1 CH-like domain in sperm protein/CAMSAP CH domain containing protein, putative [Angomonas deanei]|eukprot:EPY26043.1 sperm flagellar 1 [Angomonas deanei]
MSLVPFTEEDLHELYLWVDEVPLSRPKRNIARDFADGCCVAEMLKYYFPKLVDLHNYVPAMSREKKLDNWATLNGKVLRRLYFEVPQEEVEDIVNAVPGAVERFLRALRIKILTIKNRRDELVEQYPLRTIPGDEEEEDGGDVLPQGYGGKPPQSAPRRSQPGPTRSQPQKERDTNQTEVMQEVKHLLLEKDRTIAELRETVGILSEKVIKLEELVKVKDDKLNQYRSKFGRA